MCCFSLVSSSLAELNASVVLHEAPKSRPRDPRFEGMSGGVNAQEIEHNYSFVDDARKGEIGVLEEVLKQTKDEDDREGIVEQIRLLREQDRVRWNIVRFVVFS